MKSNSATGKAGEDAACRYLQEQGYNILSRNFKCRHGEIDIIAFMDGCVHFVEVKARKNLSYGMPSEAVNFRKKRHIIKSAQQYIYLHKKYMHCNVQIDVIEIIYSDEGENINHLKNAVWQEGF
ncbi:MAG: YraN family protein [Eubacteriales bacterium]|nr:YraN family protein [Eubacteriales bacterium]MDD4389214.1 YraN family protein [Eubacteriales bacterium]